MHPFAKKATIETLQRYAKGEKIEHAVMRIVAAQALEIISNLQRDVEESEEILEGLAPKEGADKHE